MKLFLNLICCLLITAMLGGCSVGMALSGKKDPNLGVIHNGASRGEVELQLGNPVRSSLDGDGTRTDIYEYEIGNEPSSGRAVGYGALDVLTLGLWEVAGTPIEAVQGDTYEIAIQYDQDDTVTAINSSHKISKRSHKTKNKKIKLIGCSRTIHKNKEQDRNDAIIDAKRQACLKAGIKFKYSEENEPSLFDAEVNAESEQILEPGFKIADVGYKGDKTFQVMLVGKIKVQPKGKTSYNHNGKF